MTTLPDIPRLYTALAEVLAAVLYAQAMPPRMDKRLCWGITVVWAGLLAVFLQLTGDVPLVWWIPCMTAVIGWIYLYLWGTRAMNLLEAGYSCARAFILAELAASVEWQLHCVLWPQQGAGKPLSLVLLAVLYAALYGFLYLFEQRRATAARLTITTAAMLMAVVMAVTVFAVSNLSFVSNGEATMSVFYIRTLVDFAGVLILSVQHEQLRENALHSELTAMDNVLRRQYEQYKQSKENIRLINRRYHELKMQIAAIRAERDQAKQDAALAEMESGIRKYEAENKTGNPVLDTLLTAKSLYCQQHGINMTCVADGKLLDFLSTGEICTIVGTALDNATESVSAEPDPEKRLIRVAIYAQNGFVMLRFENYCASPVEQRPWWVRFKERARRRRKPWRHLDPALGERVVHPAGTVATKITGKKNPSQARSLRWIFVLYGTKAILQIIHRHNHCAQNHQHHAGGAVQGGRLGLVGELCGDASPQQRAENAADKTEQIGCATDGKVADRAGERCECHDKNARTDGGFQFIAQHRRQEQQHHHTAARADESADKAHARAAEQRLHEPLLGTDSVHGVFRRHDRPHNELDAQ